MLNVREGLATCLVLKKGEFGLSPSFFSSSFVFGLYFSRIFVLLFVGNCVYNFSVS